MSEVVNVDDQSFEAEVMKADQPVLVDFSAAWCGPCKMLDPVVKEIAHDYAGRLKVVKVDIEQAPNTAAKFAVLAVPTLLLFRDGQVRDQVTGLQPKRAIADRVDKIL